LYAVFPIFKFVKPFHVVFGAFFNGEGTIATGWIIEMEVATMASASTMAKTNKCLIFILFGFA
jgi:hypothetical protein